jgi:hypothetical protein
MLYRVSHGIFGQFNQKEFRQQLKEFYAAGFQELVKRWDKYLNVQVDYVEK